MKIDVENIKDNIYQLMYQLRDSDVNKAKDVTDRIIGIIALSIKTENQDV